MEIIVVVFAVMVAIAAAGIAAAVLVKVVKLQPPRSVLDRLASTPGFPWVVLGVAATLVYRLLGISILFPLLVTIGGAIAVAIGLRRRDNQ